MLLRVFRFDAKDDYELYYKPYEIQPQNGATIKDALELAAAQDRYFALPEGDIYVKINGKIVPSSLEIASFITDDEVRIEPLDESRAKCDFCMDQREFMAVYDYYFAPLFSESERAKYAEYEHLFYATFARKAQPKYMGDSALVFAHEMMQRHPEHTESLKKVIFSEYGIRYAQDLRGFVEDAEAYESIKSTLKAMK